jgi:AraC-like DNA-binding protein/mannose-6-phosphate isomerase-like protein (cupin superfamily)
MLFWGGIFMYVRKTLHEVIKKMIQQGTNRIDKETEKGIIEPDIEVSLSKYLAELPEDETGIFVYSSLEFFELKFFAMYDNKVSWYINEKFATQWNKEKGPTIMHRHNYIEMTYVLEGGLSQKIKDNVVVLKPGDFCIVDQNCIHNEMDWEDNTIILWLCFTPEFFRTQILKKENQTELEKFLSSALEEMKKTSEYIVFRPYGSIKYVEDTILKILIEQREKKLAYKNMIKILAMRMFEYVYKEYDFFVNREELNISHEKFFIILDQYIRGNLESVSLNNLEERFGYGKNYYSQIIREKTGLTYAKYLIKIRLEKSVDFLLHTDFSISDIVNKVGLSNKKHFYDLFNQEYHMTPAEYREHYRIIY